MSPFYVPRVVNTLVSKLDMVPALLELIVEVGRQTEIIPQLTSWQNQDSNSGLLDMRIHAFNHSPRCLP